MSDYTINVDWDGKDALADSATAKIISGDDFQTEFETVRTALNSKADIASETLTGTPLAPTAAAGTNTTQLATTAFVTAAIAAHVVYPVGSIFTTITVYADSAAVVAALGGTTWVAFGAGKVLVGLDSGDTDFDAASETGGAKTISAGTSGSHAITTAEMPAHTHTEVAPGRGAHNAGGTSVSSSGVTQNTGSTGGGGGHTHTTPAHSLVQPYIVVYFWKRTA